ncbi:dephospho-CoA kinase [Haloimpatiens sp. FM7315]|uniref:dephospho-CoA kinase n=1 Tax=Haloimpatiens sp. FM7315 TaxID=3298609 RepID=UPI0035A310AA
MLKVGLTGGIGSGKSTVSKILKDMGIKVIDADIIAREVLEKYKDVKKDIRNNFGEKFFDENDQLKRRVLGNYIFQSEEKRKILETILMPYIKKEIFLSLKKLEDEGEKIAILDAPILIEQGLHKYMDKNILVWVGEEIQIKRVRERDKMSEEEVIRRIKSQMNLEDKKMYADFLVDNSKGISNTKKQVNKILIFLKMTRENNEKN